MTAPTLTIGGLAPTQHAGYVAPLPDAPVRGELTLDEEWERIEAALEAIPALQDAEAEVTALCEAWCALLRRGGHLARKLADPALAGHPMRPAAVEQHAVMAATAADLAMEMQEVLRAMAAIWGALKPEGRRALEGTGFPAAKGRSQFQERIYRRVLAVAEDRYAAGRTGATT